ncbi:Astra associated protein 1 Asa1 [Dispira parvispora]|uniref:ASTRA-associated protein 1 n=1 Tax=Dispira parvispora TaxID=1520584 RepID=A0A9W8APY7_9FUNG|nr:Astra associated protein 1 Asa1 [Dispira parvispora]
MVTPLPFRDETGQVYVWDLLYRRPVLKQTCHGGPVLHIQCPNSTHVVTQGRDNTCKLWRLHIQRDAPYLESRVSMECIATMNVDSLNFCQVSVARDSDDLLDCINPKRILRLYHVTLLAPKDHPQSPLYIASLHDSTGHKFALRKYDLQENTESKHIFTYPADKGLCMCMRLFRTLLPTGSDVADDTATFVLMGYENGHISLWRLVNDTCNEVASYALHSEPVTCLEVDTSQWFGFSAAADKVLTKFPLATLNKVSPTPSPSTFHLPSGGLADMKLLCNQQILATGGWDGQVRVFSTAELQPLVTLSNHRGLVHTIAVPTPFTMEGLETPSEVDYCLMASGANDCKINLWRVE